MDLFNDLLFVIYYTLSIWDKFFITNPPFLINNVYYICCITIYTLFIDEDSKVYELIYTFSIWDKYNIIITSLYLLRNLLVKIAAHAIWCFASSLKWDMIHLWIIVRNCLFFYIFINFVLFYVSLIIWFLFWIFYLFEYLHRFKFLPYFTLYLRLFNIFSVITYFIFKSWLGLSLCC